MKKVAVILSGCGVYDGSEIAESCAALLALHRHRAQAVACAPDIAQMHVVDHLSGEPAAGERRNVLVEAARLVRGEIRPLDEVDAAAVDAVLLPGGFGAAKNLSDFASVGADCTVQPQVEAFLRAAHAAGRPIGAMCIAPVILARVFGRELQPKLTIGTDPATAKMIAAMGAEHVECPASGVVVDEVNRFATTPAYMMAGDIAEVFDGAHAFVGRLLEMCG